MTFSSLMDLPQSPDLLLTHLWIVAQSQLDFSLKEIIINQGFTALALFTSWIG